MSLQVTVEGNVAALSVKRGLGAEFDAAALAAGKGGKLLTGDAAAATDNSANAPIKPRSRLHGTLNFYHRAAA